MVSEQKRKEIQKEAKDILSKFSKALEKVKFKEKTLKEAVGGFREEHSGAKGDADFRKRMFDNAPKKDDDFIIAEKKEWQ